MLHAQIHQLALHVQYDHFIILAHIDNGIVSFSGVAGVVPFKSVKGHGGVLGKETGEDGRRFDPVHGHSLQVGQAEGGEIQVVEDDIAKVFVFEGFD